MGTVLSFGKCKIRKKHQCFGCGRVFDKGAELNYCNYADEGTVSTTYMCEVCESVTDDKGTFQYSDEIYFCEVKEHYPELWEEKRKELEKQSGGN